MIFLSAKARRLVESAVRQLPSSQDRELWEDWARTHERVKQWDSKASDIDNMPQDVAAVAASALALLAESIRRDIGGRRDDDEDVVQLDNNLAYVRSLERNLSRAAH